jgi:hypothetical protein
MSHLSGLLSLFFIVAAFLTSCNGQQPAQNAEILPSFQLADD